MSFQPEANRGGGAGDKGERREKGGGQGPPAPARVGTSREGDRPDRL